MVIIRPTTSLWMLGLFFSLLLPGCGREAAPPGSSGAPAQPNATLLNARQGFHTHLVRKIAAREPVPAPPSGMFRVVKYPAPLGEMSAYLSPPPADDSLHPAIIWIFGGFDNGIGETAWEPAPASNDQSSRAFREAGIVMMYPSLRGGNDNPGFNENFYGEVDDILAAADLLAQQTYVDTNRTCLGGHSTGGTLAMLVAESTSRFRAAFAFGPVADVGAYPPRNLFFDIGSRQELELRAPIKWLPAIASPTFIFEGTQRPSNLDSLNVMSRANHNAMVRFHPIRNATHFSTLAPVTKLIAAKILHDTGPAPNISFTDKELAAAMQP